MTRARFDEAAQMIEEPLDGASPTFATRAALVKAKLLARRGQFAEARGLAEEGARLAPAASPLAQATVHEARAEVERLAGAPGQAAARLRAALQIYENRRAMVLAERPGPLWPTSPLSLATTWSSQPARRFNTLPARFNILR